MTELLKDIDDLPEELKRQLDCCQGVRQRTGRPSSRYPAALVTMLQCDGFPSRDELRIGIYRKAGTTLNPKQFEQTLYRMRKKGWITGTHHNIRLVTEHPYVQRFKQLLELRGEEAVLAGLSENASEKRARGRRDKPAAPATTDNNNAAESVELSSPPVSENTKVQHDGITIRCSNCCAEKQLHADDARIVFDGLDFCSFRCKREYRDTIEEG